jgi:energy-coupling factor transporter ATP-binding protein EcfA2
VTTASQAVEALRAGIEAARTLELDVGGAEGVLAEATERLGLAPDAYVVAFVGGTGVGKSTLLNALAGEEVSPAGPRRPTTSRPVAWMPASPPTPLDPLLDRLGVGNVVTHAGPELGNVVALDLPDIDSLERSHRAAVEAVLPKVDVVAWVTDPEKYADAVLHDDFVRDWLCRLDRQIFVIAKADRLDVDGVRKVTVDLGRLLAREVQGSNRPRPPIIPVRALDGAAGVAELRRWLDEAVDAKAVIAGRVVSGTRAALEDLAVAAGVGAGTVEVAPLVTASARAAAIDGATEEVLLVVDLAGTERQAIAATRSRARRRGTGPIGLLTTAAYRLLGRRQRDADPTAYLRSWRNRGGLTRAADIVRRTIVEALGGVPPALRKPFAAATEAGHLEGRLGTELDRVIARQPQLEAPSSRFWPLVGLLQTMNTLLLVFAAAWVVVWILARPAVASFDVPVLGPIPAPLALLAAGLAIGYVLARILSLHAGWLGRRWARRVTGDVRDAVGRAIRDDAFAPIDRLEVARAALAAAWRRMSD